MWQHRVSAWTRSRSVCGQVRTRLGLDTRRYWTPAWVLFKARVCSVLGPWDSIAGGPDPIRGGGSGSHSRGPACTRGGPGPTMGVRTVCPGVRRSPVGSGSLLTPWNISPSLDTWRLRTRPCGGVRCRCGPRIAAQDWCDSWSSPTHNTFTTRLSDSRVGTASLYSSKAYPSFTVPTVAPGPPQGRIQACRWGQSLDFASTWHDR
jgi:hypothetical protein